MTFQFDKPEKLIIKHLPANTRGRDFVVGDIHGMISALHFLMEKVGFDKSVDRLISVGDWVDRGEDSMACLKLLTEPYVVSVRGNHEDMTLENYALLTSDFARQPGVGKNTANYVRQVAAVNGQQWLLDMIERGEKLPDEFLQAMNRLPHVLCIGEGENRFNVVHAELWTWEQEFTDAALDTGAIRNHEAAILNVLWSRDAYKGKKELAESAALSTTFCGHTPVEKICRVGKQIFIDTGAFKPYLKQERHHDVCGLTFVEPIAGQIHFISTDYTVASGTPSGLGRFLHRA